MDATTPEPHRPTASRGRWRPLHRCATIVAAASGILVANPVFPESPASAPDVLLIVLDTVRPDRLSTYGHARPTSMRLTSLAATGVAFRDVTSPSNWTWPAHASIFTGEPPWVHGAHFGRGDRDVYFDWGGFARAMRPDLPTLAERFRAHGYDTVFLTANPVLAPPLSDSLTRGFDEKRYQVGDPTVLDDALSVLKRESDRPLFLFVNLNGAHNPYQARPVYWLKPRLAWLDEATAPGWLRPYLMPGIQAINLQASPTGLGGRSLSLELAAGRVVLKRPMTRMIRDLYDGELTAVDSVMGALVEAFRSRSGDDAVIAVTSDHGEYLGEHNMVEHTYLLYTEVLKVPLVLSAPGRLPSGISIETPVELHRLHATLLDLAVGERAEASLCPLAAGETAETPIRAIAYPRTESGVEELAYVYRYYRDGTDVLVSRSDGKRSLYDLSSDPGMNRDLSLIRVTRVQALAEAAKSAFPEAAEATGPV